MDDCARVVAGGNAALREQPGHAIMAALQEAQPVALGEQPGHVTMAALQGAQPVAASEPPDHLLLLRPRVFHGFLTSALHPQLRSLLLSPSAVLPVCLSPLIEPSSPLATSCEGLLLAQNGAASGEGKIFVWQGARSKVDAALLESLSAWRAPYVGRSHKQEYLPLAPLKCTCLLCLEDRYSLVHLGAEWALARADAAACRAQGIDPASTAIAPCLEALYPHLGPLIFAQKEELQEEAQRLGAVGELLSSSAATDACALSLDLRRTSACTAAGCIPPLHLLAGALPPDILAALPNGGSTTPAWANAAGYLGLPSPVSLRISQLLQSLGLTPSPLQRLSALQEAEGEVGRQFWGLKREGIEKGGGEEEEEDGKDLQLLQRTSMLRALTTAALSQSSAMGEDGSSHAIGGGASLLTMFTSSLLPPRSTNAGIIDSSHRAVSVLVACGLLGREVGHTTGGGQSSSSSSSRNSATPEQEVPSFPFPGLPFADFERGKGPVGSAEYKGRGPIFFPSIFAFLGLLPSPEEDGQLKGGLASVGSIAGSGGGGWSGALSGGGEVEGAAAAPASLSLLSPAFHAASVRAAVHWERHWAAFHQEEALHTLCLDLSPSPPGLAAPSLEAAARLTGLSQPSFTSAHGSQVRATLVHSAEAWERGEAEREKFCRLSVGGGPASGTSLQEGEGPPEMLPRPPPLLPIPHFCPVDVELFLQVPARDPHLAAYMADVWGAELMALGRAPPPSLRLLAALFRDQARATLEELRVSGQQPQGLENWHNRLSPPQHPIAMPRGRRRLEAPPRAPLHYALTQAWGLASGGERGDLLLALWSTLVENDCCLPAALPSVLLQVQQQEQQQQQQKEEEEEEEEEGRRREQMEASQRAGVAAAAAAATAAPVAGGYGGGAAPQAPAFSTTIAAPTGSAGAMEEEAAAAAAAPAALGARISAPARPPQKPPRPALIGEARPHSTHDVVDALTEAAPPLGLQRLRLFGERVRSPAGYQALRDRPGLSHAMVLCAQQAAKEVVWNRRTVTGEEFASAVHSQLELFAATAPRRAWKMGEGEEGEEEEEGQDGEGKEVVEGRREEKRGELVGGEVMSSEVLGWGALEEGGVDMEELGEAGQHQQSLGEEESEEDNAFLRAECLRVFGFDPDLLNPRLIPRPVQLVLGEEGCAAGWQEPFSRQGKAPLGIFGFSTVPFEKDYSSSSSSSECSLPPLHPAVLALTDPLHFAACSSLAIWPVPALNTPLRGPGSYLGWQVGGGMGLGGPLAAMMGASHPGRAPWAAALPATLAPMGAGVTPPPRCSCPPPWYRGRGHCENAHSGKRCGCENGQEVRESAQQQNNGGGRQQGGGE